MIPWSFLGMLDGSLRAHIMDMYCVHKFIIKDLDNFLLWIIMVLWLLLRFDHYLMLLASQEQSPSQNTNITIMIINHLTSDDFIP